MSRRRVIETDKLIEYAEDYINKCCGGNVQKFKIAKFSRHLKDCGMAINEPVIRRNAEFMKYFYEKKEIEKAVTQQNVVYERLDIDELLNSGRSYTSIRTTLTNREEYYKLIYDSFVETRNKIKEITIRHEKIKKENEDLRSQLIKKKEELASMKASCCDLKEKMTAYKEQITEYVYPSIAAEIIKTIEPTLIKETPGLIDPEVVAEKTVGVNTNFFNNSLINELYKASIKE